MASSDPGEIQGFTKSNLLEQKMVLLLLPLRNLQSLGALCQGQGQRPNNRRVTPNILITWEFISVLGALCQEPGGRVQNMYFLFLP